MRRVRVIPVLLLQDGGLVKSVKFKNYTYVGDPINAVKIFNEKEVDEIALLDISATTKGQVPDIEAISDIASEAFMPMSYGGGITTLDQIKAILFEGIEKVILNNSALHRPELISEGARLFGSQAIVASIDVKKTIWGKYKVFGEGGSKNTGLDPIEFARKIQNAGAGEILLNNIDRDGTYKGYDLELIGQIANSVEIPVVACGGASQVEDFERAVNISNASAVSAGSLFVFHGPHKAVLINYPNQETLKEKLFSKIS